MRQTAIFLLGTVLMTWLGCSGSASSPPAASPGSHDSSYDGVTIVLPKGAAQAGRQAFLDLKCYSCHRVADEPGFPPPVTDLPGPQLDLRRPYRSPSDVATAIVSPSHSFSTRTSPEVRARLEGALSPMGDFSQVMTVRQLADLVEYLRTTPAAP